MDSSRGITTGNVMTRIFGTRSKATSMVVLGESRRLMCGWKEFQAKKLARRGLEIKRVSGQGILRFAWDVLGYVKMYLDITSYIFGCEGK